MLNKFFNKKKANKGFTLVELVIVVAILAILVGLLAPQYTKYVEKSRKAADASNLDNLVTAFKVATADGDHTGIEAGTYLIQMSTTGTTIKAPQNSTNWIAAIKEYTGETFANGTENGNITLKSSKWTGGTNDIAGRTTQIGAKLELDANGTLKVTYDPDTLKAQKG